MANLEQLRSLSAPPPSAPAPAPPRPTAPHRRWQGTLAVAVLAVGFVGLFLYVGRGWLRPAVKVTGVRAVALKLSALEPAAAAGPVLFQASGWIEPEPYPVKAASFVAGVVATVPVLDGQHVERGAVLATLDDRNLRLAIAEAEAETAALAGELLVLTARIGEAEREIALADERQATAEAELARLRRQADILQRAGEAIPLIQREDARLAVERQRNAAQEAVRERELRVAALQVARAEEDAQRHKVAARQAALDKLRLDLERSVIRAPIAGIVQRVAVRVGQMVNPDSDTMDSAVVATLYDPARLQVRVDVALADAAGLAVGMPARIATEALPDRPLSGVVTSIAGQADLTKNTLQAKVRLLEPPPSLRPEMLARVEFLPVPRSAPAGDAAAAGVVRAMVPEAALLDQAGDRATAWVATAEGTVAERRAVTLGTTRNGAWREVREGLGPGEIVILSGQDRLRPGCRVRVELAAPPESDGGAP